MARLAVELDRVPETLLWTLYHRAIEARRGDAVLLDPLAVDLVDRSSFPFEERFGSAAPAFRSGRRCGRCVRRAVDRFLAKKPEGTVVALGEGLETQFWRVDNGRVRWLTVELPEVDRCARRLLPAERQVRARLLRTRSALDRRGAGRGGVLVTAQGLLMYLAPEEARGLVARCAERFGGGGLVFDVVPRWLVERSRRGLLKTSTGYEPPPWSWGFDRDEEQRLRALPHVAGLQALRLPRGRGLLQGVVLPAAGRVGVLRRGLLSVLAVRFAPR